MGDCYGPGMGTCNKRCGVVYLNSVRCEINPSPLVPITIFDILTPRGLQDVLMEKYHWDRDESTAFASFLTPMLAFYPPARTTAHECLQHSWLKT